MASHDSWGRYPRATPQQIWSWRWQSDEIPWSQIAKPVLPYGQGRSQGDVCLNDQGTIIEARGLNHFVSFDRQTGILRFEAGVTLAEISELVIPYGWFLAVTPGTKYVTVGGAVANDVHGKNHHREGTFGMHVRQFELLRSDDSRIICSPTQNQDLFKATIGGLGLTGLMSWVEIQLQPIKSSQMVVERIAYKHIRDVFSLATESAKTHQYVVVWFDSTATGKKLGQGVLTRANHASTGSLEYTQTQLKSLPIEAPNWVINPASVKAFNWLYALKEKAKLGQYNEYYEKFFYPLDSVLYWNRLYGRRGFLQYQWIIPNSPKQIEYTEQMLDIIARSGQGSFLSTIKFFSDKKSPGLVSYPREGIELAVDFAYLGQKTHNLFNQLDKITLEAGGRVYPAKDAHMSPETFKAYFPQYQEFQQYIDPAFSSSFARRVGLTS